MHLSFQEYLAAEHAAREALAGPLASRRRKAGGARWLCSHCDGPGRSASRFFGNCCRRDRREHPDLAQRCLEETLYFTPGPFLEVLQRPRPQDETARQAYDTRVAAVLRLLRDRVEQVPELEDICHRLADSPDPETRGFAREILARLGIEVAVEPAERGVFVDERTGISFVSIPAGEFQMGSERGPTREQPVHRVCITQGFQLGKYPVTNGQYGRFLEAAQAAGKSVEKPDTGTIGGSTSRNNRWWA